jgi:hypothetical protein
MKLYDLVLDAVSAHGHLSTAQVQSITTNVTGCLMLKRGHIEEFHTPLSHQRLTAEAVMKMAGTLEQINKRLERLEDKLSSGGTLQGPLSLAEYNLKLGLIQNEFPIGT